ADSPEQRSQMLIDVAVGKQQRGSEFSFALPFSQQLKGEPLGGRDLQHKISPLHVSITTAFTLFFERISCTAVPAPLYQRCPGWLGASRFVERRLTRDERFKLDHQLTSRRVASDDFAQTPRGVFVRMVLEHSPYCVADRICAGRSRERDASPSCGHSRRGVGLIAAVG